MRFARGQPYSPGEITNTQYALEDSNYFSLGRRRPGRPRPRDAHGARCAFTREPIKRDRYGVNVGYGTDTGVRGQFTWDNRRVNRAATACGSS